MFTVTSLESLPNDVRLLLRGSQISYWDVPQEFLVASEIIESPLSVSIVFRKESEGKASIRKTSIVNNRIQIEMINPHQIEPTAIIGRQQIAALPDYKTQLTFSIIIFNPGESGYVLFHYEFYEEPLTDSIFEQSKEENE